MTDKKYELVIQKEYDGVFRLLALKDFSDVKKGDLGGFVQSESNLSQEGNCWVYDEAVITGRARVYEDARIRGRAWICNRAEIFQNAEIFESAVVGGTAKVSDSVLVYGESRIEGNAVLRNVEMFSSGRLMVEADVWETRKDSRGYTFLVAWKNKEIVSVTAGCRVWDTVQEARNYFLTDYESDGNVDECLTILRNLEETFRRKTHGLGRIEW